MFNQFCSCILPIPYLGWKAHRFSELFPLDWRQYTCRCHCPGAESERSEACFHQIKYELQENPSFLKYINKSSFQTRPQGANISFGRNCSIKVSKQKFQSVLIRVCLETDEEETQTRQQIAKWGLKEGKRGSEKHERMLPIGFPFLSHTNVGGGIPVASHTKVTGLLMDSLTNSCSGPSILGGTVNWMEAGRMLCKLILNCLICKVYVIIIIIEDDAEGAHHKHWDGNFYHLVLQYLWLCTHTGLCQKPKIKTSFKRNHHGVLL